MKKFFKENINHIKNKQQIHNIILFIFIFFCIFSIIISKPLDNLDELWNYNTARVISEGKIPYKNISMITTPLLPMLTSVFLKLIANQLIVSRILASILCASVLFTIYKILFLFIKEENASLIFTALIGILCRDIFCIDYNLLVLFFSLIILYNELKNKKELFNKKTDLLIRLFSWFSNMHKTKHRSDISFYSCYFESN